MPAAHEMRIERLSELVTQLSGAPLERSRTAVGESSERSGADSLRNVAEALVSILDAA